MHALRPSLRDRGLGCPDMGWPLAASPVGPGTRVFLVRHLASGCCLLGGSWGERNGGLAQAALCGGIDTPSPNHLVTQRVKSPPAMQETWVRSLGQEDPLEKGMTAHSSILAWRIPWTEEPGMRQSVGSQRVRHDRATKRFNVHFSHTPSPPLTMRWKEGEGDERVREAERYSN